MHRQISIQIQIHNTAIVYDYIRSHRGSRARGASRGEPVETAQRRRLWPLAFFGEGRRLWRSMVLARARAASRRSAPEPRAAARASSGCVPAVSTQAHKRFAAAAQVLKRPASGVNAGAVVLKRPAQAGYVVGPVLKRPAKAKDALGGDSHAEGKLRRKRRTSRRVGSQLRHDTTPIISAATAPTTDSAETDGLLTTGIAYIIEWWQQGAAFREASSSSTSTDVPPADHGAGDAAGGAGGAGGALFPGPANGLFWLPPR